MSIIDKEDFPVAEPLNDHTVDSPGRHFAWNKETWERLIWRQLSRQIFHRMESEASIFLIFFTRIYLKEC